MQERGRRVKKRPGSPGAGGQPEAGGRRTDGPTRAPVARAGGRPPTPQAARPASESGDRCVESLQAACQRPSFQAAQGPPDAAGSRAPIKKAATGLWTAFRPACVANAITANAKRRPSRHKAPPAPQAAKPTSDSGNRCVESLQGEKKESGPCGGPLSFDRISNSLRQTASGGRGPVRRGRLPRGGA